MQTGLAIDYCRLDLTRLALLLEAGENHREAALRKQIQGAYEGVMTISKRHLDAFEPDEWDAEDVAFILSPTSDFNRMGHLHRAEYLRAQYKRAPKKVNSADLDWRHVESGNRRNKKLAKERATEEKRGWVDAVVGPSREPEEEESGGAVEEVEATEAEEEVREPAARRRTLAEAQRDEKKKRAKQVARAKAARAQYGNSSGDPETTQRRKAEKESREAEERGKLEEEEKRVESGLRWMQVEQGSEEEREETAPRWTASTPSRHRDPSLGAGTERSSRGPAESGEGRRETSRRMAGSTPSHYKAPARGKDTEGESHLEDEVRGPRVEGWSNPDSFYH